MPIYPYYCADCQQEFETVKPMARWDEPEFCSCGFQGEPRGARFSIANAGDWKPTFNPALGTVIRSKAHQREVLARLADQGKKMIEVGNEPVENFHKAAEQAQKERREERWAESADKIMKDVLS